MNDAADEPSKPTSPEPEFRKFSDEELQRILENHKTWMEAEDKTGLDDLRADLSRANLLAADLRGASLRGANLSRASLWNAILTRVELREADLREADLSGANLSGANLSGANLSGANLSGAHHLTQAQLDGACGHRLPGPDLVATTQLPQGLTIKRCPVTAPQPLPLPPAGSS
jgi:Pentapeptide repeats (8 copies)